MSTYTKERNFIIITLDGASADYRLDINSGVFYGMKGSPIKTCPRKGEICGLFPYWRNDNGTNLGYALRKMFSDYKPTEFHQYTQYLMAADKLDSAGIPLLTLSDKNLIFASENIKLLVAYLKEVPANDFSMGDFKAFAEFEKVRNSLGTLADQLTAEMYHAIISHIPSVTKEELAVCTYYLTKGKLWEYENHNIRKLTNYIDWCRLMDKKPEKVSNFMREYVETHKTYELRKTEFNDKKLRYNYEKQAKAWEFEYGNYQIVIPTCGQDIVLEGQLMHHCVGGYVNNVIENSCYICFVRNKADLSAPYITCQVYTDGEIGQYFLAYDKYISKEEDKVFRQVFGEHLRKVWVG